MMNQLAILIEELEVLTNGIEQHEITQKIEEIKSIITGENALGIPNRIDLLPTNVSLKRMNSEEKGDDLGVKGENLEVTASDVLGPFYVLGSPFRGIISPFTSEGQKIIIRGSVMDEDGVPLPFCVIDMWQANPEDACYDFYWKDEELSKTARVYHPRDDPKIIAGETGGGSRNYDYRTRILTDHKGCYEVCTVIPPPYFDPDDVCECETECLCAWRCPHIHSFIQPSNGTNKSLITQLYFENMPYNDTDKHFTEKTTVRTETTSRNGVEYLKGFFDFVVGK